MKQEIAELAEMAGLSFTEDDAANIQYWLLNALEYTSDRARREPTAFNLNALAVVRDFIMKQI